MPFIISSAQATSSIRFCLHKTFGSNFSPKVNVFEHKSSIPLCQPKCLMLSTQYSHNLPRGHNFNMQPSQFGSQVMKITRRLILLKKHEIALNLFLSSRSSLAQENGTSGVGCQRLSIHLDTTGE